MAYSVSVRFLIVEAFKSKEVRFRGRFYGDGDDSLDVKFWRLVSFGSLYSIGIANRPLMEDFKPLAEDFKPLVEDRIQLIEDFTVISGPWTWPF